MVPTHCMLCPRRCGTDRMKHSGRCGGGHRLKVARAALHFWEEPCISGTRGSGAVFFSGCPLGCCFCQNEQISAKHVGAEITVQRLADIFGELVAQKAHNINLVSPTHYVPWIVEAFQAAQKPFPIPVVYNTSGYENVDTLRQMDGIVDIYLPDLKFMDAGLAQRYAGAPDYFDVAQRALAEMFRQVGPPVFGKDGLLQRGMMIRHLVLPGARADSIRLMRWIAETFPKESVLISLMSQYTPFYKSSQFPEINRRITTFEYNSVLNVAEELGLQGYMQEKSSAKEEYTPLFDLTGVLADD